MTIIINTKREDKHIEENMQSYRKYMQNLIYINNMDLLQHLINKGKMHNLI